MSRKYEKSIAFLARPEEERILLAHTEDLLDRVRSGSIAVSDFLNLGEQFLIRAFLSQCGMTEGVEYLFFGGFPHAERQMLFLFPDYIYESLPTSTDGSEMVSVDTLVSVCLSQKEIGALSAAGSGYKTLGHRDYLGSLLALGVERSVIGDICVLDGANAVIFAKHTILPYLETALERIGADKVRTKTLSEEAFLQTPDTRRWETISDTVAAPRLDAVVAAAANLSREKAKQLVASGFVEVDFRLSDAPDTMLSEGTYLSIRGHGRYYFDAIDGTSKKGRLRIRLKKRI